MLNADIDLENITLENGFGNMKDFDFDGQDHKISSVTINYNGTDNTGLFVGGNRGISNLVVENVKVNAPNGTENAVGIVSSDANADITNVTVRNSSVTGGKYFRATDNSSLDDVFTEIDALEKTTLDVKNFSHTEDHYMLWAWLAFGLFALELLLRYLYLRSIP